MLGPLSLVAVGKQHDESGVLTPFDLRRGQEVVDDDLRPVGEVAELRFPCHQGLGCLDGVAVLEPHRGILREQRVADGEQAQASLPGRCVPAQQCRPTWANGMYSSAVL